MMGSLGAAGAVSLLLDLVPVIAGILLLIAFLRGRGIRRSEEMELRDKIRAFSQEEERDTEP